MKINHEIDKTPELGPHPYGQPEPKPEPPAGMMLKCISAEGLLVYTKPKGIDTMEFHVNPEPEDMEFYLEAIADAKERVKDPAFKYDWQRYRSAYVAKVKEELVKQKSLEEGLSG